MTRLRITLIAAAALLALSAPAEARRHRATAPVPQAGFCLFLGTCAQVAAPRKFAAHGARVRPARAYTSRRTYRQAAAAGIGASVVAHPAGCPRSQFCGCGAAVRVFGTPRRDLWLASNWLRFPRASPAPGMVAARRGHVFVLESHVSGNTWIVYDANSGGRQTRIHARSLAGYAVVNPRA